MYRVGIDIGGTFTDLVFLAEDGQVIRGKVLSTPEDYSRGIAAGLRTLFAEKGLRGSAIAEVIHGTTIATNAILERKGATTGLITTAGFRDVLEIRRLRMPNLYDLFWEKPEPLVPRHRRLEVEERVDHRGEVVHLLDPEQARGVIDRLLSHGVDAIAVCLLNAYANPVHEERLGAMLREHAPGVPVCLSSEILPEIREYERTSTTVVNAYIMPVVSRYLTSLTSALGELEISVPLLVMQSNGGAMRARAAAKRPIHIIESGPAAGVVGALELARKIGIPDVITFDMGGTTAKTSMIEGDGVTRVSEYEVGAEINPAGRLLKGGGHHVRVPAIDIVEVGAGGGSLVWLDKGGSLRVGPESAGADPGPVCYDQGGKHPTVTDANVVLGLINPRFLVGGALALNADKARAAIRETIANPLGLSVEEAAHGTHLVANAAMARAVRTVSTARGRDPRQFALMAYGGNGPVHAATLARSLEIPRVIVPPIPGLFSALGLLCPDVEHHYVRTRKRRLEAADPDEIHGLFRALEEEGGAELAAEGYGPEAIRFARLVDLRYVGENSELTIPVPEGGGSPAWRAVLVERFSYEHERTYGYRSEEEPVELLNLRLIARGVPATPRAPHHLRIDADGAHPPYRAAGRRVFFGPDHGWIETPMRRRGELAGAETTGPLIVEEYDSTTVVPPGCQVWLDGWGNLIITVVGIASTA
ncbi:MAG: hydantoinase/oxoprolinase family protein [Candidatus Methylomirabilia bacterium]